jgi:phosphoserine phosphatase RsbU/P
MKVLIADDSATSRAMLRSVLTRWGYDVVMAENGKEALDILAKDDPPPMAVLDWVMPELTGPEVCRRVRETLREPYTYILLLTSKNTKGETVEGLEAGADDYIVKPFDPDELRARVQVGIRVLTLQERLADRVAELQDALTSVKRLQGLLPICSYCKRIRGDDQYWQQVDSYIVEHSDAQFTHGICPPCSQKLMAEIEEERNRRM